MIRKFGGSAGIDMQPQGLDLGLGGSNIKSMQNGSFVANTTLSYSIPISSVDVNKSVVIVEMIVNTSYTKNGFLNGEIQDSTHILIDCAYAPDNVTVKWWVIEFNNVKSLQKGTVSNVLTSNTNIAISSVDVNKCLCFINMSYTGSTNTQLFSTILSGHSLTNTQLTITQITQAAGSEKKYKWQVIEFN